MHHSRQSRSQGFSLVEILVALGLLAVTAVAMTQAMLVMNRNAAISRVRNLAKAVALGRVQEVAAVTYAPNDTPAVVPALLNVQTAPAEAVNLGDASTGIGNVPASLYWTVANVGTGPIRSIKCRIDYTYLGRKSSYEVLTFRSPD